MLPVGATNEQIIVEAESLHVDLETPAAAGLISGTQIRELAINTRNYAQLVALQPGVSTSLTSDQMYVGVSGPNGAINVLAFSINGNRPGQNNWTLDGADNLDRGMNQTLLTYPSIDSVEEFRVLRGNYSPEFGRSSAGQINVITRSGTKNFHGGIYEFFRNDLLAANNFFNNRNALPRSPLRYNDFGFTFGGPLRIPGMRGSKANGGGVPPDNRRVPPLIRALCECKRSSRPARSSLPRQHEQLIALSFQPHLRTPALRLVKI